VRQIETSAVESVGYGDIAGADKQKQGESPRPFQPAFMNISFGLELFLYRSQWLRDLHPNTCLDTLGREETTADGNSILGHIFWKQGRQPSSCQSCRSANWYWGGRVKADAARGSGYGYGQLEQADCIGSIWWVANDSGRLYKLDARSRSGRIGV